MGSYTKAVKALIAYLRAMKAAGGAESGQLEAAVEAVKDLDHALRVGDIRRVQKLVGTIAKLFVK